MDGIRSEKNRQPHGQTGFEYDDGRSVSLPGTPQQGYSRSLTHSRQDETVKFRHGVDEKDRILGSCIEYGSPYIIGDCDNFIDLGWIVLPVIVGRDFDLREPGLGKVGAEQRNCRVL